MTSPPGADGRAALHLAATRLAEGESGIASHPVPADPPPEALGALEGFGLAADGADARVSVYLFDRWGGGQEHAADLVRSAEEAGRYGLVGSNGPALIFGVAPAEDFAATLLLGQWCSAFAGRE